MAMEPPQISSTWVDPFRGESQAPVELAWYEDVRVIFGQVRGTSMDGLFHGKSHLEMDDDSG